MRPIRAGAVATGVAAALVLLPGTAAADVTVAASRAEAGARDVTITFRVTNDDPAVPTTRLEVFLPTVRPLLGVAPTAPTGWTARVATAPPAAPLTVDGEPVPGSRRGSRGRAARSRAPATRCSRSTWTGCPTVRGRCASA